MINRSVQPSTILVKFDKFAYKSSLQNKFGIFAGVLYVCLLFISIPYLIISNPSFNHSLTKFDPVSNLGMYKETSQIFMFVSIIEGSLLFCYIHFHLERQRPLYRNFKNWDSSLRISKLAPIGQIGVGVFDKSFITLHLLSALFLFAGFCAFLFLVSFLIYGSVRLLYLAL